MDPTQFDRLSRWVAHRPLTRRRTLAAAGAALAALVGATTGTRAQTTPTATPSATGTGLAANNSTLFVQTATGGTFAPNPTARATPVTVGLGTPTAGQHGAYVLTLHGHSGETIGFSDRPKRDYGELPTPRFFTGLGFAPTNPPNAALVVDTPQQQGAVVLVELLAPQYDESSHTLTYETNLLHQYPNAKSDGLAALAAHAEATPPAAFTHVSLFIDDCPDSDEACYYPGGPSRPDFCNYAGDLTSGNCWNWSTWTCKPCGSYSGTCNRLFAACNDACQDDIALCGTPLCCSGVCCAQGGKLTCSC